VAGTPPVRNGIAKNGPAQQRVCREQQRTQQFVVEDFQRPQARQHEQAEGSVAALLAEQVGRQAEGA
jgi:hypothetical protein